MKEANGILKFKLLSEILEIVYKLHYTLGSYYGVLKLTSTVDLLRRLFVTRLGLWQISHVYIYAPIRLVNH